MRCAENGHNYHSGQVMQPNGSTQEIKHGKYRKRHRDKEKRAIQQAISRPPAKYMIVRPGVVIKFLMNIRTKDSISHRVLFFCFM